MTRYVLSLTADEIENKVDKSAKTFLESMNKFVFDLIISTKNADELYFSSDLCSMLNAAKQLDYTPKEVKKMGDSFVGYFNKKPVYVIV